MGSSQFSRIASGIDVRPLLGAIERTSYLWHQFTQRQSTPGSPHSDTESIFLRWAQTQSIEAVFHEIPAVDYPAFDDLIEARALVGVVLEALKATELGRVLIVKLRPGGYITPHVDEGVYADHYSRFHLPLVSEDGNIFFSEIGEGHGEFAYMKPGDLWWFNHKCRHWVWNTTSSDRIHLIVDAVSPFFRRETYAIPA